MPDFQPSLEERFLRYSINYEGDRCKTNETYHPPKNQFLSVQVFSPWNSAAIITFGRTKPIKKKRRTSGRGCVEPEKTRKESDLVRRKGGRGRRSNIVRKAHQPGGSRYYLLPVRSTFPLSSLQRE